MQRRSAVAWRVVSVLAWISGVGVVLCLGAAAASLATFGYQGEGWVFLLPALPLGAVCLILTTILALRRIVRRSRHS